MLPGTDEHVAALVTVSPSASYLTGTIHVIDGGLLPTVWAGSRLMAAALAGDRDKDHRYRGPKRPGRWSRPPPDSGGLRLIGDLSPWPAADRCRAMGALVTCGEA